MTEGNSTVGLSEAIADLRQHPEEATVSTVTKPMSLHRGLESMVVIFGESYGVDPKALLQELNSDSALATLIRQMVGDIFGDADTPLRDLLLTQELRAGGAAGAKLFDLAAKIASEKDASGVQRRNVQSGDTIKGNAKRARRAKGGGK